MKKTAFLFIFALLFTQIYGQKIDSLALNKKLSYKQFIIPAVMITGGSLLLNSTLNNDIQEKSRSMFGPNFYSPADYLFPLIPIGQIYAGKYLGFEPKNTIPHQSIDLVLANSITVALVSVTKKIAKQERPDQSNDLSFPSGHTAIAFTNAALLFQEYKESNLWYASSGFLFATATGVFRIANNKHFTSDVLAGAGLGLASGIFVSYFNPLQALKYGKNRENKVFIYPQIGNQIGIGLLVQPN